MSKPKWPAYLRALWSRYTFPLPALCLVLLLTSCSRVGVETKPTPSNGCEWVTPIYVSKTDTLSDGTARQILVLDETWLRICGHRATPPPAR